MTIQELRAAMEAAAKRAEALVPKLRDSAKARSDHAAIMDEFDGLERQLRAAEQRESLEFSGTATRGDVGRILDAVIDGREVDGLERELQTERGLASNQIPIEMLRAATPAPADVGSSEQPVVQPVFAQGDMAFLRIPQRTVPVGDAVFPILTTRPTVGGPHTDSTEVAETDGVFSADVLKPGRLQAAFSWRHTDAARFRGMDSALRSALNAALSEAIDKEMIDQIVTDVARTDAAAQNTYATYRSALVYNLIDGRFATGERDLRVLVGNATLTHAASKYRTNSSDEDAATALRSLTSGVRVSPHIAAVAASKQDTIVRRGGRADAVAALWQGVTLIPDRVTRAKEGEVRLTALLLAAFKVMRDDGFARVQVQHA